MPKYNFDLSIDRRGTHCKKVDMLDDVFGRHDLLPLWIADMDFPVCPEISDALVSRFGDDYRLATSSQRFRNQSRRDDIHAWWNACSGHGPQLLHQSR